jgi:phosphoglycerate dehydrogenase-like enzyme
VVDQAALEAELADGRFRAFLDVYEKEPPPPECSLYRLPNVMMMPHMGGPTIDLRRYIAADLLRETAAFLADGTPSPSEITPAMARTMSAR